MLSTRDRRLVLDTLRPPAGFELDFAIGTSYSLDLLALLAAPLSFTLFEWKEEQREGELDRLALLDALRRFARRIHLFCQAGQIRVPAPGKTLLAYLEGAVVEAMAPLPGASFHPKAWVLRYRETAGEAVRYRLLCATRNLTFDRCWDTALVLDGELLQERKKAIAANHPLADFVAALPGLAVRGRTAELDARAARMAEELRKVRFEPPEGVDEVYFVPFGLDGRDASPVEFVPTGKPRRRLMVVSPFLTGSVVEDLAADHELAVLVSTSEALDAVPAHVLAPIEKVMVLRPEADVETRDVSEGAEEAAARTLRGLHAKLYVMDDGWTSRVWTGSANATLSGLRRNVELMVELVGRRKVLGIDALLGSNGGEDGKVARDALSSLLQPYRRAEAPRNEEVEAAEVLLRETRARVARASLSFVVRGSHEEGFSLELAGSGTIPVAAGVTLRAWPVSLRAEAARPILHRSTIAALWEPVSFEALTAFCAFEVTIAAGETSLCERFALALPLVGAPPDREERLLTSLLRDPRHVLRLLLLLLAEEELVAVGLDGGVGSFSPFGSTGVGQAGEGLLESLLVALEKAPHRLDEVARLLADLASSPSGRELLPPGLSEVWDTIWKVRLEQPR